jgi:hypothetical protein
LFIGVLRVNAMSVCASFQFATVRIYANNQDEDVAIFGMSTVNVEDMLGLELEA